MVRGLTDVQPYNHVISSGWTKASEQSLIILFIFINETFFLY